MVQVNGELAGVIISAGVVVLARIAGMPMLPDVVMQANVVVLEAVDGLTCVVVVAGVVVSVDVGTVCKRT